MRPGALFILMLMLAAPLSAAPRKAAPKPAPKPAAEEKLIQSCDAHKFETIVDTTDDNGQPKKSKVKLCGVEGQSDAEWIGTLKDAIRKLEANKQMPAAQREQIVSAIKAEIGRLSIVSTPVLPRREVVQESATGSLSRDYAALPPLPAPIAAPPPIAPPPVTRVETTTIATAPPAALPPAQLPLISVPKLSFSCYTPGDIGGEGPCTEFGRDTLLTVKSGGKVPAGAELRFVRNGEDRGAVVLAPLTASRSMPIALPREVCSGFGAGRLELQVVVNGSPAPSEGPWPLRCN